MSELLKNPFIDLVESVGAEVTLIDFGLDPMSFSGWSYPEIEEWLIDFGFNPDLHPRWPKGSPDHLSGRFMPKSGLGSTKLNDHLKHHGVSEGHLNDALKQHVRGAATGDKTLMVPVGHTPDEGGGTHDPNKPAFHVGNTPVYQGSPGMLTGQNHNFLLGSTGTGADSKPANLFYKPDLGQNVSPAEIANGARKHLGSDYAAESSGLYIAKPSDPERGIPRVDQGVDGPDLQKQLRSAYPGAEKYHINGETKPLGKEAPSPSPSPSPAPSPAPSNADPTQEFKVGKIPVYGGDPGNWRDKAHNFAVGIKDGKPKMLFYRPEKMTQLSPDWIQGHALNKGAFDKFLGTGRYNPEQTPLAAPKVPKLDPYVKDTPEVREAMRKAYPDAPYYIARGERDPKDLNHGGALGGPAPEPKPPGDTPAVAALKRQMQQRKASSTPPDIEINGRPAYKDKPKALANKPHVLVFGTPEGESKPRALFAEDPVTLRKARNEDMGAVIPQDSVLGQFDPKDGLQFHSLGSDPLAADELKGFVKDAYPNEKRFKLDGVWYRADSGARPAGSKAPVSDALRVPTTPTFKPARDAIDTIGKVHDDGELPQIPVGGGIRQQGLQGFYDPQRYRDRPKIQLRGKGASNPHLTAVHEIGHFLDDYALGAKPKQMSTRAGDEEVTPILQAADKTKAVGKLKDMRNNPDKYATTWKGPVSGQEYRYPPDTKHLSYLLDPAEVFARGYAQYIAEKSKDSQMQKELAKKVAEGKAKEGYSTQWDEADFAPMRAAFDKMFADRGWLK